MNKMNQKNEISKKDCSIMKSSYVVSQINDERSISNETKLYTRGLQRWGDPVVY